VIHDLQRPAATRAPLAQAPEGWVPFRLVAKGKKADIFIFSEIGYWGVRAQDIVNALDPIKDATEITLHLNSNGGEVFDGMAIYNILAAHPAKKITKNYSIAASMASVLFLVGEERLVGTNAQLMIHDPEGGAWGNGDKLRKQADLIDSIRADMVGLYANRTGGDESQISSWMAAETWFNAAQCVENGFATGTFTANAKAVAQYFSPAPAQAQLPLQQPKRQPMTQLLAALGLAADATEEQALGALSSLKQASEKAIAEAKAETANVIASVLTTAAPALKPEEASEIADLYQLGKGAVAARLLTSAIAPTLSPAAAIEAAKGKASRDSSTAAELARLPKALQGLTFTQASKDQPAALTALMSSDFDVFNALYRAEFGTDFKKS
jgi:ATP-dependent protease ClpP protease subunit